jgi:hypothetical protein
MEGQHSLVTIADMGDDSDVEVCDSPREQWLGEHVVEEVAFVYREEAEARSCEGGRQMTKDVLEVDEVKREEVDSGQHEGKSLAIEDDCVEADDDSVDGNGGESLAVEDGVENVYFGNGDGTTRSFAGGLKSFVEVECPRC